MAVELLLNFIKGASDVVTLDVFSAEFCFKCDRSFLGNYFDRELAFGVAVKVEGFFYTRCRVLFTEIDDFLRSDKKGEVFLFFTSNFRELELSCDDWLNGFLAVFERFVETLVGDELGRTFDHQHFGLGSDVDQVEVGIKHFVVVWVGDEFAINLTNAHTSHRTIPRDVRDQCRS